MERKEVTVIGFTIEEAAAFIKSVVKECISEFLIERGHSDSERLNTTQACRFLGVSHPTLKKLVDSQIIRRHDLGQRRKVYFKHELEEDIKKIQRDKVCQR